MADVAELRDPRPPRSTLDLIPDPQLKDVELAESMEHGNIRIAAVADPRVHVERVPGEGCSLASSKLTDDLSLRGEVAATNSLGNRCEPTMEQANVDRLTDGSEATSAPSERRAPAVPPEGTGPPETTSSSQPGYCSISGHGRTASVTASLASSWTQASSPVAGRVVDMPAVCYK